MPSYKRNTNKDVHPEPHHQPIIHLKDGQSLFRDWVVIHHELYHRARDGQILKPHPSSRLQKLFQKKASKRHAPRTLEEIVSLRQQRGYLLNLAKLAADEKKKVEDQIEAVYPVQLWTPWKVDENLLNRLEIDIGQFGDELQFLEKRTRCIEYWLDQY